MPLKSSSLMAVAEDSSSITDLRTYFGVGLPGGHALPFTGGRFESLGGGGDLLETADRITAHDLIAVQMLSVKVPGPVALDLLEGDLGETVSLHLAKMPTDVAMGSEAAQNLLSKDGPAWTAWSLLRAPDDMGWVTAGKLLARKRPALVPVYDRVIRCALRRPDGAWGYFQNAFSDEQELPEALLALKVAAAVPDNISLLRVLDVILWMRHRGSHTEAGCRGLDLGS